MLDHFSLPTDPDRATEVMRAVTEAARALAVEEVCLFAPPDTAVESLRTGDGGAATVVRAAEAAGWEHLVDRLHYEFTPTADLGAGIDTDLSFEVLTHPEDPRLADLHARVMRGTLDAHDADAIERLGLEEATRESLAYLLEADPVECIHLATDPAGAVAGLVSGRVMPDGRSYLLFVGVAAEARGRGRAGEMVAWMSRDLVARGATTLIADTDTTNTPMARAFADAGWPVTETRIDFVLR